MNIEFLKRSRTIAVGDLFVYRIKGHPFGYGRVIRVDARIGGFEDVIMIYIYDAFSPVKHQGRASGTDVT